MNILTLFFLLLPILAFTAEPAGKVIALEGTVSAVNTNQATRFLQVNDSVYPGDTIIVAQQSKVQIGFTDGSLLNLVPQTTYQIKDYQYRKLFKKDHYLGQLVQGGFRTLSGSIAKKNPDDYQVETPNATIGIRGTIFEVFIADIGVFFGCSQGAISVTNTKGTQWIGPTEPSSFAVIPPQIGSIQLLSERPALLNLRQFTPPPNGLQLEAVQANPKASPYPPGGRPTAAASTTHQRKGISAPGPQPRPTGGKIIELTPQAEQAPTSAEGGSSLQSGGC